MSYDFDLFELEPDADLHETMDAHEQAFVAREEAKTPHFFTNKAKERNQAIIAALKLKDPNLDGRLIATANMEAIEIDAGEKGDGIQISLYSDEGSLTVPYWHKAERAHAVFLEIWDYLRIVQQITAFVIYDSQLDQVIDLETDFENVLSAYLGTMAKIAGAF